MIITAMRLLLRNDDSVARAELAKNYHEYILKDGLTATKLIMSREQIDSQLPKEFVEKIDELAAKPVTDLVDKIIELFGLDTLTDQSAYLCSFQDVLANFMQDGPSDIAAFSKAVGRHHPPKYDSERRGQRHTAYLHP